jgi:hypothetical protein
MAMIATISFWGGIGIGMVAVGIIGVACVLIDGAIHKRRLRKMQRATDEARQRQTEQTRRASFLP